MKACLPSWKGTSALVLTILVALFLPALIPAGRSRLIDPGALIFAFVVLLSCLAPSFFALRERKTADRIAGVLAIGLALLIAYMFYDHATS